MNRRHIQAFALAGALLLSLAAPAWAQRRAPGAPGGSFNSDLPTLWLVGDSTVKNGRGDGGDGGRWGWGDWIAPYFNTSKINVQNRALGGTSSRTFSLQFWPRVLESIKPGDFVMIQLGHNDGGLDSAVARIRARATLPGNGDNTIEMDMPDGRKETVHTYGWYIRKIVTETQAKGATPIVCSLIPRDDWTGPHEMARSHKDGYVMWAEEAAKQEDAFYINLNLIIAQNLNPLGQDFALGTLYRTDDHTHTTLLGADFNAWCVVSGLKALGDSLPLVNDLSPTAQPVKPAAKDNVIAGNVTPVPGSESK